jgi:hypothetical protein
MNTREKSSQTRRIYLGGLRDEKNRKVCLMSRRRKL